MCSNIVHSLINERLLMGIYDCVFIMMYITNTLHYSTYCLDRLTGDDLSQLGENEMQSGNLRYRNATSAGAGWRQG